MNIFRHSGDLGDIVYALPTVRAMGGGRIVVTPNGFTRVRMDANNYALIHDLLEYQSYIHKSEFTPDGVFNVDLDRFRSHWHLYHEFGKAIAAHVTDTFRVERRVLDEPWLTAPIPVDPHLRVKVLFSRSLRYQNHNFPWKRIVQKYGKEAAFVGTKQEHEQFVASFGAVDYLVTPTLLELAKAINLCHLFVGNQSCPYAIAEGLKVNTIQETFVPDPNCRFVRENARYVAGDFLEAPDLAQLTPKPRIGIITLYDGNAKLYGELTARQKEAYARHHGYGFHVATALPEPGHPASWNRLHVVNEWLPHYDWIFWTDADSLILDPTIRLERFIDDRVDFIPAGDEHGINCGAFFLRNSPMGRRILNHVRSQPVVHEIPWEQKVFKEMLWHNVDILGATKFAGDIFNVNTWAKAPGFMLHLWAKSHEERYQIVSDMLCKKK